jgi:hypothetical protein
MMFVLCLLLLSPKQLEPIQICEGPFVKSDRWGVILEAELMRRESSSSAPKSLSVAEFSQSASHMF